MTTTSNRLFPALALAAAIAPFCVFAQANTVRETVITPSRPTAETTAPTAQAPAAQSDSAGPADVQTAPRSETRFADRIAAVVNTDVITEYELQNRVRQASYNLRRQNINLPPMPELRRQVLEQMITEKATEQRAKELGIRVDEQMVSASIEQIARNNKLTVDELRERLRDDDVSFAAFRRQVRDEIVAQRLREREVDSKITIPESEVDALLAEQAGFTGNDTQEYHIQHILLPVPSGASDSEVRDVERQAEELVKRARDGEDFASLAAANSKADDAMSGGDLGWRNASRLPTIFWKAIENHRTQRNYITVVRSSGAFHVVHLADSRDGVKAKLAGKPVEQTHVRHILMFISDLMPEDKILSRLHDIRNRIAEGKTDFATMARLNSVDNSATRGGDIGWVQPGDTVPEFESVMNRLQPGEISEPVRTPYGYHLIQVIERRTASGDAERSRIAARAQLREKKLAEAVYNWRRELRDRAYVEIRNTEY